MYMIWNDRMGEYYLSRSKADVGKPALFRTFEQALAKMSELGWLNEKFHRVRICDKDGNDVQVFDPA